MTSLLSSTGTHARDFLAWWANELTGMLPQWLRQGEARERIKDIVVVEHDGLHLLDDLPVDTPADTAAGWSARLGPVAEAADIAAQVGRRPGRAAATPVGLRIPYSFCFSRLVELPASAADDFGKLLSLDMERATPFRSSEVFTAYTVAPRDATPAGKAHLRHYIVKRALIDRVIGELDAAGLRVMQIDCWNETGTAPLPLDFGSATSVEASPRRSLARQMLAASLLVVGLSLTAAYGYVSRLQEAADTLQSQVQQLRLQAASKREAEASQRAAQKTLAALDEIAATTVPKLLVLDELTRLLPDTTWVNDLRLSYASADLTGYAASAVALLPILEKSPRFVDASSSSPVTFDPREEKERFGIHVRYRMAYGAANPAKEGDQ